MPKGVYPRPPRKPTPKLVVRTLRPDEERPDGEPRRYPDKQGYVRLRWRVGPHEYVEIREHRAVLGVDAPHVHHRNHDPSDNRRENLVALTPEEHAALHGRERRKFDRRRAAQLYVAGLSTVELGRLYGVNPASLSRALRAVGVAMRPFGATVRIHLDEPRVLALHDTGMRARAIAAIFDVDSGTIKRVLKRHGREPYPPGRPPKS